MTQQFITADSITESLTDTTGLMNALYIWHDIHMLEEGGRLQPNVGSQ